MNTELQKKALEKVGNPLTLINLVARRVRQLNAGGGAMSRPLIADYRTLGVADIALREVTEDKITFERPAGLDTAAPAPRKRRKR